MTFTKEVKGARFSSRVMLSTCEALGSIPSTRKKKGKKQIGDRQMLPLPLDNLKAGVDLFLLSACLLWDRR
jgi:hypothetical protein